MRDCLNNRGGFDRVLMAVAATFLTVSATSVLAQDQPRSSAAELAIEAAIPRPEPANVPPPTINDFKLDTTGTVPETAKADAPATLKDDNAKSDTAKSEPAKTDKTDAHKTDTAAAPSAPAPAAASVTPAAEQPKEIAKPAEEPAKDAGKDNNQPTKAASNVPSADQPVADKLKDMLGAKTLRYFERKAERTAVEKFYGAREYAPLWTQAGALTDTAKGVIARLKNAASEGLDQDVVGHVSGLISRDAWPRPPPRTRAS